MPDQITNTRRIPDSVRTQLLGTASECDARVAFRPVTRPEPSTEPPVGRGEPTRDDLAAAQAKGETTVQVAAAWGITRGRVEYLRMQYGLVKHRVRHLAPEPPALLPESAPTTMTVGEYGTYTADYLWRYLGGLSVLFERLASGEFEFEIRIRRVVGS